MNSFETFKQLHQNSSPFVLGNTWDVKSAQVFEAAGYKAIGISSQALANSLGYEDGENLPFEVLLQKKKKTVEVVKIPFSVDMEGGYSRSIDGIISNISKLHDAGVVGINLEDTLPGATRQFQTLTEFQKVVAGIANHFSRNNLQVFLNIRTDAFLLGTPDALAETLIRVKAYQEAGADGIFAPCITNTSDIKTLVNVTTLPVNVMCMPNLPGFDEFASLGVKRISMGPFLFNKVYATAGQLATAVINDNNFSALVS